MNNKLSYKSMANKMNNLVFRDIFYRLMMISKSVYEWKNLPNGMNEKWIEDYLFSEGRCVFFKDKTKGFMVTALKQEGNLNFYNEEIYLRPDAINYNYDGEPLENGVDCVIIKNNDESLPTSPTLQIYAHKLTTIDRTIDVNILAQKTPIIISCSEKERLSLLQYIDKRNDNEPVIFVTNQMNTGGIKVDDLRTPVVFKDLEIQKHMVWNEVMTYLGINNANMDKKERLVDDEVQANNEQVEACLNAGLKARQQAVKEINKIFGTEIEVCKRIKEVPKMDEVLPKGSEGSKEGVLNV